MLTVTVFKTYKYVIRRFFPRLIKPFNAYFFNLCCLFLVCRGNLLWCKPNSRNNVLGLKEGFFTYRVARGYLLVLIHVIDVNDSAKRKSASPVCFMIILFLEDDVFKSFNSSLKVTITKSRPGICSVNHRDIVSDIYFPLVATKFTYVIISYAFKNAPARFASIKLHVIPLLRC